MASTHDDRPPDAGAGSSDDLSPPLSMPGTPGGKGKKRVGFSDKNGDNSSSSGDLSPPSRPDDRAIRPGTDTAGLKISDSSFSGGQHGQSFDELQLANSLDKLKDDSTPTVLRSALRKGMSSRDNRPEPLDLAGIDDLSTKLQAEHVARARATGLERDVASAPGSRSGSPARSRTNFQVASGEPLAHAVTTPRGRDLHHNHIWNSLFHKGGVATGQNTPDAEELEEYFPEPPKYRAGGLSAHLLSSWWTQGGGFHNRSSSFGTDSAPSSPGAMTPTFHVSPPEEGTPPPASPKPRPWSWSRQSKKQDFGIANLVTATASTSALAGADISAEYRKQTQRPDYFSTNSNSTLSDLWNQPRRRKKRDIDITIKKHVRETETRKRYILKLCRALMEYGAPTHRLEAYLSMTSRVLEIEAQFLYFPGTMIISFDDARTHTTEMKLVRVNQGVDLGKMKDTHNIYKDVSHDLIGVEEGLQRLEEISKTTEKFPVWVRILAYGFGSAFVAPFAFNARLIDLPLCFGLGLILGVLQLLVAPKSDLYASVFEIAATIITSFLSRLFGSISYPGQPDTRIFCFSALTQSSIALILPGFTVLSAALELQSRSIVAGSVRIVYAIVYSLWIGYGLTIGTAIYGAINHDAESHADCYNPLSSNPQRWTFLFVPAYTLCLAVINQAKWRQMPMMLIISFAGYQVNYWASQQFKNNTQLASTLGAAAIGVLANGYSRAGRRLDEVAARFENWVETTVKENLLGFKGARNSARPQGQRQRRKSSVAESLLGLLPKPIRPRRFHEEDVEEGSSSTGEDEDTKADSMSQATTAGGEQSDSEKPETETPDQPHIITDEDGNQIKVNAGTKIGRDGKPKQVNYVLAAAAMLPAIFVQVPSGVSVAGSLVSGLEAANQLTNSTDASTGSGIYSATDVTGSNGNISSSVPFTVAASVVQVAIGITIGLFIGSIIVYPTGKGGAIGQGKKSRSGLFAF